MDGKRQVPQVRVSFDTLADAALWRRRICRPRYVLWSWLKLLTLPQVPRAAIEITVLSQDPEPVERLGVKF